MTPQDDYLWDGSGPVDPGVAELEALLAPLRYAGAPPAPPKQAPGWMGLALAAGILLAFSSLLFQNPDEPGITEGWVVESLAGAALCDSDTCSLGVGEWLETGADGRARLEVADIGEMELGPHTRLRLKATGPQEHRLELARGRVEAFVIAPPRLLIVETPAATAVDLGCAYTLEVDDDGDGVLTVTSGWVALEAPAGDVLVPRGATARMTSGHGPGIPRFTDAPPALVRGLDAMEAGRAVPLAPLLKHARPRDTLSLWHLLQLQQGDARAQILDRIIELVGEPLPERSAVLAGDADAMRLLQDQLTLDW
ncbi:MAG: FecR domain-containing protein [Alphaproteobacteria bacterium]|nr:FecR domain-containing protein [Alphaproteobacteria bacterium]